MWSNLARPSVGNTSASVAEGGARHCAEPSPSNSFMFSSTSASVVDVREWATAGGSLASELDGSSDIALFDDDVSDADDRALFLLWLESAGDGRLRIEFEERNRERVGGESGHYCNYVSKPTQYASVASYH